MPVEGLRLHDCSVAQSLCVLKAGLDAMLSTIATQNRPNIGRSAIDLFNNRMFLSPVNLIQVKKLSG
ncbi:MAG: hypothetical protein RLZZ624_651 [Cyanobacteriota bacterium]